MNFRIILMIIYVLLNLVQTKANLRIILDRVEPIDSDKESKVSIAPSNNSYAQGEIQVSQDVDSDKLKVSVIVIRCLVGEAPDTCEFLINLKPPNPCMAMNARNMAWSNITEAYTPNIRCPLKKGNYVGDKVTFDANKWKIFPLDKFYFKVTFRMYEGDVLILAFIMDCHFVRIR